MWFPENQEKKGGKRRDLRRRGWPVKAGTNLGSPLYLQGVLEDLALSKPSGGIC